MDLQQTIQLLAAKGDNRHVSSEALIVLYRDEDEGTLATNMTGDYVNMKRMFIDYAKTNGFFRRILLDAACFSLRSRQQNSRS